MKMARMAIGFSAALLMLAAPAFGQGEKDGIGQVIVTIVPKHEGGSVAEVSAQAAKLKVNGKDATIKSLIPMKDASNLELVLLLDSSSRTSLGTQLIEIEKFIRTLPPSAKLAVAYMQFGNAVFSTPFSTDREQAVHALHLPSGTPGSSGSPYFCISDLAKRWPQGDGAARREVLMVTDGVDEYNPRYDPEDPYVQAAIKDAVKSGIVLYSIYWRDQGRFSRTGYANNAGQNLMVQVTEATGGKNFWDGFGNPVSFEPYFDEFSTRLKNQYELSFIAPFSGKPAVEQMKLKVNAPGAQVDAPQQVFVVHPGIAQN